MSEESPPPPALPPPYTGATQPPARLPSQPPAQFVAPPPATPATRGRGKRVLLAAVVLFVFGGAAAAGLVYWQSNEGPAHPDAWNPRVVDLVGFVEEQRGATFEHPVAVNFLSPEEYAEANTGGDYETTDEDREYADRNAGLYRTLGLVSGPVDLIQSSDDLLEDGTAAYYDSITEQVHVNGEVDGAAVSPSTAVTVVHELTHALQDQLFDLDGSAMSTDGTTDQSDARLSIVEGDAMVVGQAYVAQLSDTEFDAYSADWDALVENSAQAVDDAGVPDALDVMFGVPYAFGPSWILLAHSQDAADEIDDALAGDAPPSVSILDLVISGPDAEDQDEAACDQRSKD